MAPASHAVATASTMAVAPQWAAIICQRSCREAFLRVIPPQLKRRSQSHLRHRIASYLSFPTATAPSPSRSSESAITLLRRSGCAHELGHAGTDLCMGPELTCSACLLYPA
eukprot:6188297-Pleurochrysis_carterae.AAC.3